MKRFDEYMKHFSAEHGCDQVTIWKTTEPGDMNTFGVTDRYLDFNYRGPDWDQNNLNI